MNATLTLTADGLWCERGGFHIDPWRPVERAVITHGHADHCRPGSRQYLTAASGVPVLRLRLGKDVRVQSLPFGEAIDCNGVRLSLHPAGHIPGSAQIRVEDRGHVTVVTGDYRTVPDACSEPFELLRCHTLVSECTFGLPVFRWPEPSDVIESIRSWWAANQTAGRPSVIFAYALGKAQRLLAALDSGQGAICCHGAVQSVNDCLRGAGLPLPPTTATGASDARHGDSQALVMAPPSAIGSPWLRRFRNAETAFISGWMQLRGHRRRRGVDRGFVLSDHADWGELNSVIKHSGAERILLTHGYSETMSRWLREQGLNAEVLRTPYEGELDVAATEAAAEEDTE